MIDFPDVSLWWEFSHIDIAGNLYISDTGKGVYRFRNSDDSWELLQPAVPALGVDGLGNSGHIFAATLGRGVYRNMNPVTVIGERSAIPIGFMLE